MSVGAYSFGRFIVDYIERNGYSQNYLANKLEVSPSTINRWKQGKAIPDLKQVVKLSELTGTGVEAIIGMLFPEVTDRMEISPSGLVVGHAFDESSDDVKELILRFIRSAGQ